MQCCRCCASSQQASLSERSVPRKPGNAAFSLARIGLKGKFYNRVIMIYSEKGAVVKKQFDFLHKNRQANSLRLSMQV
jgi:hypothetical protein